MSDEFFFQATIAKVSGRGNVFNEEAFNRKDKFMCGMQILKSYSSLLKWKETSLLVMVSLMSALIAGHGAMPGGGFALLAGAGILSCGGSAFLNNYLDRDIDAMAMRTRLRPLPAGNISPGIAFWLGIFFVISGILLSLKINQVVSFFTFLGAFFYVVVYTLLLKRRSSLNIEIGGLAGCCAALAGWFAASPLLSPTPFLIALLLFLWTPPHFWSFAMVHRQDYEKIGIPVLPAVSGNQKAAERIVIYTSLLVAISLLFYFLGLFGPLYLMAALLLGGLFLGSCIRMRKNPSPARAWSNYKLSGIYLIGLLLTMLLETFLEKSFY